MAKINKFGEAVLNELLIYIDSCDDDAKNEIAADGVGAISAEFIRNVKNLAAYWLYVYGEYSFLYLKLHEGEIDSPYIFELKNIKITFDDLREYLKKCIE